MIDKSRSGVALVVVFALLLFTGVFVFSLMSARAEPYIAARTGFKCGQCHVNRTGGGKRTDFGLIYSQTHLNMGIVKPPSGSALFDAHLNEWISVGANFRTDYLVTFEYESSLGEKGETTSQSGISEANLYVEMDLIPETVILYVDQTLAPSSGNRELFGLVQNLPRNSFVKVGRMLLPYGLRLLDNDAFIRNRTGYTYSRQGTGVELGLSPGPLASVANLTDDQLSIVAALVFRRFQLGGSFARNTTRSGDSTAGPFAGLNFGRFTLLGEADFIDDDGTDQLATFTELNYLIRRGFNFKATYEFFDRNRDVSADRDGQERFTVGIEPFVAQFVQLRLFYRYNSYIPQNVPGNQDQLLLEFHLFF